MTTLWSPPFLVCECQKENDWLVKWYLQINEQVISDLYIIYHSVDKLL